jgi:small subunit ribosomal protein S7
MSRRHSAEKREINPDAKFGNLVISKFMNTIMIQGKKSVAEAIVYGALEAIEGKTKSDPIKVFEQALDNVMPSIEVRSRRVGGATYQVPVEVRSIRRQALGIRWMRRIIGGTPSRSAKTHTGWRKPTAPSRTIAGNGTAYEQELKEKRDPHAPRPSDRGLPQFRHHGAHRCRQDDDD